MPDVPLITMDHTRLVPQILNKCKHFNGLINKCCDAGVKYEDVAKEGTFQYRNMPNGPVYTLGREHPCLKNHAEAFGIDTCPKREWVSQAEAEAEEAESKMYFRDIKTARAAIVKRISETNESSGTIECPICKGSLSYSRAKCNGHIHARCDGKDCVAWME